MGKSQLYSFTALVWHLKYVTSTQRIHPSGLTRNESSYLSTKQLKCSGRGIHVEGSVTATFSVRMSLVSYKYVYLKTANLRSLKTHASQITQVFGLPFVM